MIDNNLEGDADPVRVLWSLNSDRFEMTISHAPSHPDDIHRETSVTYWVNDVVVRRDTYLDALKTVRP